MKIKHVSSSNEKELYQESVKLLQQGKIVLLPTDTIDGLSARADRESSIRQVFQMKDRDFSKPLLILVSSLRMARQYCYLNTKQSEKLKKIWSESRPTSVLLKHRSLLPPVLNANSPYLAVRLPKSVFLRKMIKAVGVPLVSTSFNRSGELLLSATEAADFFQTEPRPALVLVETKNKKTKKASRLISLDENACIKLLRA
jgi:L-threonylcarbamoyladenylate synthase